MAISTVSYQRKQKTESPKESTFGKLLGGAGLIAGGVAGAMSGGGFRGAVLGAQAGSNIGGTVGNIIDPARAGGTVQQSQASGTQQMDGAISRRLAQQASDKLTVLKQAEQALPFVDKDIRDKYASTIVQATIEEERRRAMGA